MGAIYVESGTCVIDIKDKSTKKFGENGDNAVIQSRINTQNIRSSLF